MEATNVEMKVWKTFRFAIAYSRYNDNDLAASQYSWCAQPKSSQRAATQHLAALKGRIFTTRAHICAREITTRLFESTY